jgi:hypothetical protein
MLEVFIFFLFISFEIIFLGRELIEGFVLGMVFYTTLLILVIFLFIILSGDFLIFSS